MGLYIKELIKTLEQEDRNFRKSTIILHDGAKYAQSNATINTLRNYKVPYMLLSPYSYNVAPIELLFGAIKTGFINPEHLPTGKG